MNVFEILFEEIAKYNALGSVMLIDDLNARTGNLTEKLVTDSSILDNELNCDFNSDADIQLNKRVNKENLYKYIREKLDTVIIILSYVYFKW